MENKNDVAKVAPEAGVTVYKSAGEEIKLSFNIVKNYLTRGNGNVTQNDCVQFISLCKFNQLNPFLNEAYLVKFGTQPAQMIVSKDAFMKRAEASLEYDGFQAGIIVRRKAEGTAVGIDMDIEGCFLAGEDILVGGWAKVYRKDRKYPIVARVSLKEYDKKQSLWNEKPSTMIRKVALVQALREAFPAQLGAMYIAEERGVEDAQFEDVTPSTDITSEVNANANKDTVNISGEVKTDKPEIKDNTAADNAKPMGKQDVPDMFK